MRELKPLTKLLAVIMALSITVAAIWVLNNRVSAGTINAMPVCGGCRSVFSFGMVGITNTQTARFSVVNNKKCNQSSPCAPAQIELRFVNSTGNVVTNMDNHPKQTTMSLGEGQSGFLDLNGASISNTGRTQIRAEITNCSGCGTGKGTVLATLEVFDNTTGNTTFVMPDYPAVSSHEQSDE